MGRLLDPAWWELMSYVVTVIGLPLAIVVFLAEQRKERQNEEDAVYESLSERYQQFLHVMLQYPELRLFSMTKTSALDAEQHERMIVIFGMLVSLFERAYLLLYEEGLRDAKLRRWRSWEDYMQEWCAREDFRDVLDDLLIGEDPAFCDYIRDMARALTPGTTAAPGARRG
jgi:hypothetical protein